MASIGHAIVQAARLRLTAPPQLSLAIQMHHHFGSRFLIDSLHQHGFCSSYIEVQKFEKRAAATNIDAKVENYEQFIQYAGDNVDHNIKTLDGHGTFHGMGMIVAITPGQAVTRVVPKVDVTSDDIITAGKVEIVPYAFPKRQEVITFRELDGMTLIPQSHLALARDILWKMLPFCEWPRPGWSGFMQMTHEGSHPEKGMVFFLPMIDMDPTDMTCIYSTLLYIAQQAKENNITPVITFDQPLWWKAHLIIANEPPQSSLKSIVLRLGGLHTEMSFLGCIGHLMANSGLSEVLEVVYGSNAVIHMLTGKALARARRGHFLVDAALNIIILARALHMPFPTMLQESSEDDSQDHVSDESYSEVQNENENDDESRTW
jgi:hypothetical protein